MNDAWHGWPPLLSRGTKSIADRADQTDLHSNSHPFDQLNPLNPLDPRCFPLFSPGDRDPTPYAGGKWRGIADLADLPDQADLN
jgi:hypothetical protein